MATDVDHLTVTYEEDEPEEINKTRLKMTEAQECTKKKTRKTTKLQEWIQKTPKLQECETNRNKKSWKRRWTASMASEAATETCGQENQETTNTCMPS